MSAAPDLAQLRERMQRMQDGVPRLALQMHPALAGVATLRAGSSYEVHGLGLAMALMAGPSRAGGWSAVVGVPDFGAEAAAGLGIDLSRTVLVPEPGEQWLEVTAALVDVAQVVLVRPQARVTGHVADRIGARLRKRSSVLLAQSAWPGCEARLRVEDQQWSGVGLGHGHLRSRRLVVAVQRGAAPPRRTALWFPGEDGSLGRTAAPPAAGVREAG